VSTVAAIPVTVSTPMMGGRVSIHLLDAAASDALEAAGARVLARVEAWAARLTRFSDRSELSRLNAARRGRVAIGATLTAVLDWARTAEGLTDGLVDVAMLDARLAAETGQRPDGPLPAGRRWSLRREHRGAVVRRDPGLHFDLDGVAKGWLADRALDIAPGRSAVVDGDGDVAVRAAPGDAWAIGIADPRDPGSRLGVLDLRADGDTARRWGVATSGTSVHRWARPGEDSHHLIDPRTFRPAVTDVVQATVLAGSAREAEAFAKAAVVLGSAGAFTALDRPGVRGLLLLTDRGAVRATPGMTRWLA
jgi:thiamine biosynthesis lipoprotein